MIKSANVIHSIIQKYKEQENLQSQNKSEILANINDITSTFLVFFPNLKIFEDAYRRNLISRLTIFRDDNMQNYTEECDILEILTKSLGYTRMSPTTILVNGCNRFSTKGTTFSKTVNGIQYSLQCLSKVGYPDQLLKQDKYLQDIKFSTNLISKASQEIQNIIKNVQNDHKDKSIQYVNQDYIELVIHNNSKSITLGLNKIQFSIIMLFENKNEQDLKNILNILGEKNKEIVQENLDLLCQNPSNILLQFPDKILYNLNVVDKTNINYFSKYLMVKEKDVTNIIETKNKEFTPQIKKYNTETTMMRILKKERKLEKQFLFTLMYGELKKLFNLDNELFEKSLKTALDRQYIEIKDDIIEYQP